MGTPISSCRDDWTIWSRRGPARIWSKLFCSGQGGLCFHVSGRIGGFRTTDTFLKRGAGVNFVTFNCFPGASDTPLRVACLHVRDDIVQMVLEYGPEMNPQFNYSTALHTAAFRGYRNLVLILMDRGADIHPGRQLVAVSSEQLCWAQRAMALSVGHYAVLELL